VPLLLKKAYIGSRPEAFKADGIKKRQNIQIISLDIPAEGLSEDIKRFFKKKRWSAFHFPEMQAVTAVKNRFSPLGFLLFHLSFFLFLLGGLLLTYTRFSGKLALTEGQSFDNDIKQFHRITDNAKIMKQLPALGLFLEKVQPFYENNVPTELVVNLKVNYKNDVKKEILKVNEPIKRGPMSIIAENIGVSPLFIVKDKTGRIIDSVYVSLNVLEGQEDNFTLDLDRVYTFYVRFFSDYVIEGGVEKTKSLELKNPAIHLTVKKDIFKDIYEDTIKLGESAQFDSYIVEFNDLRYWTEFLIVREYGKYPLMLGFVLASVGLLMRLVFYQKKLWLAIEDTEGKTLLYIYGKSDYLAHSFKDETERLINDLEVSIKKT
jgi:cytochrome c biogenesis protein